MGHPIRWQSICGVDFYRIGRSLRAEKGKQVFVITRYKTGGWEASVRPHGVMQMPVLGAVCASLRDAVSFLQPHFNR